MLILAYLLSFFSLILNLTLFIRLRPPYNFMILWIPQLLHHALSPLLIVFGLIGAILGWLNQAWIPVLVGLLGAGISLWYIQQIMTAKSLSSAGTRLSANSHRTIQTGWHIGLPRTDDPIFEQNIVFWTAPDTHRKLLCDVWQPPHTVERSGLAIVYLHGSGWYLSDKDVGTRPIFRQFAAQGHVVMDVAYRLCPEVDIYGMVGDVKQAVAWIKANAGHYLVNPERVVLMGASAGGHLALLAAYTADHPQLTPAELLGQDLSVHAVVSNYGPTDLRAVYHHTDQSRVIGLPKVEIGLPDAAEKDINMQDAGRLDTLLGGHLHEFPEIYDLASPVTHVHDDCPPTLLIHGDLDCVTPTKAINELYDKLVEHNVPAVFITYPLTQHAFDLVLPQISPPAQQALYEVELFLERVA